MTITTRAMVQADCAAIATLLVANGYTVDAVTLTQRLARLQAWPDQVAFVAEANGTLAGICQVQGVRLLATDGYAMTQLLAINPTAEQANIAQALLNHAADWAFAAGYQRFRMRIRPEQEMEHDWLTQNGFGLSKAGYVFTHTLQAEPAQARPSPALTIRPATAADAAAIAQLMPDLGYEATEAEVTYRLARIRAWPENANYLAEHDGVVVGLCQLQTTRLLAQPDFTEVEALVVAANQQGKGIGRALLAHAVRWAAERGQAQVRLGSGAHRTEAHAFYEAQGFVKSAITHALERRAPAQP